jgi:hypothetical protein
MVLDPNTRVRSVAAGGPRLVDLDKGQHGEDSLPRLQGPKYADDCSNGIQIGRNEQPQQTE